MRMYILNEHAESREKRTPVDKDTLFTNNSAHSMSATVRSKRRLPVFVSVSPREQATNRAAIDYNTFIDKTSEL